MRTVLLVLAVTIAVPSYAQIPLTPRRALLSDSTGQNPVKDTKASMFLIGLGLAAAGLVLGGAGFAILYVCREGQACHSDKTLTTVGWVVAAPGVIPLGIGLLLMYISSGGKSGRISALESKGDEGGPIAFGLAPLPGGGAIASGAFRF